MAQTPTSAAASNCTPAEFLRRYDARTVGQLCSQAGRVIDPPALLTDPNLQTALDSAEGMLQAACFVGARYVPEDIAALTGCAAAYRNQLISDLTMGLLVRARPDLKKPLPPAYEMALEALKQLREGYAVFGLQESMDAGLLHHDVETAADVEARCTVTTIARRFFGRRSNRINCRGGCGGC